MSREERNGQLRNQINNHTRRGDHVCLLLGRFSQSRRFAIRWWSPKGRECFYPLPPDDDDAGLFSRIWRDIPRVKTAGYPDACCCLGGCGYVKGLGLC